MPRYSGSFERKLRDCLGITRVGTLAAATSLAMAGEGAARPLRVPVDEILPNGDLREYDLNNDGRDDLRLECLGDDWYLYALDYTPPGTTGNTVPAYVFMDSGMLYVHAHEAGDVVPSVATDMAQSGPLNYIDTGPFYNQSAPRFAGLYLCLGDTTGGVDPTRHFAWAELNVTPLFDLEVTAFGYETKPDTPIIAGSESVPVGGLVPLSLGLLAAGAWMARRRLSSE